MAPGYEDQIGLLRRMGKGDTSALAELYDRVAPTLLGVIRRIVRDQAESEDVLQEVILQAWTRVQTYDPVRGTPLSWLVRIARNRAIDRYRSKRVKAHLEDPPVAPVHASAAGIMDDDPERAAVNAFDRRRLEEILASLPPEQRVLIEQAFFSGLTHSELSEQFDLPLGTVKTRIRQGLLAMREALGGGSGQHRVGPKVTSN